MEYMFVLRGRLGVSLKEALEPVSIKLRKDSTEMTLDVQDDAQLYGALAKLERLGIGVVGFGPVKDEVEHDA